MEGLSLEAEDGIDHVARSNTSYSYGHTAGAAKVNFL